MISQVRRLARIKGVQIYYSPSCAMVIVGLRPVIQILCHVLARGWGRWLRYFTEAKAEVKYRASARIRGPKHDTRFEWPVSILIMTRHPFLPFKTHKTSAKNPRLLTITGAIWFCRYRQCTSSQLWILLLRSADWWRHNILFSIARTIWILSEYKLSTDNFVNY